MRFVLYETQKKNVVEGYALTRITKLGEDEGQREELSRMLTYIDPCLTLVGSSSKASDMAEWYKKTFGVPGTPEFEKNVEKMNKKLHENV